MSTRSFALAAALVAFAVPPTIAAPAIAAPAGVAPVVERVHGPHLLIVSAYLRESGDRAVVRGTVRRDPLWRGPLTGHLHVTAWRRDGALAGRCMARWQTTLGPGARHAAAYQCDLGALRAGIVRLRVAYTPGIHQAGEAPQ